MKRSLRSWLWRVPVDREVDDELALHVELRTREGIARGLDPATARAEAIRRLGDVAALKKTMAGLARKRDREMNLVLRIDEFHADKEGTRRVTEAVADTVAAVLAGQSAEETRSEPAAAPAA